MALTRPAETRERGDELPSRAAASNPDHVGNRTINNALTAATRSVQGAARRLPEKALQSRRVHQPGRDRAPYSPGAPCHADF